MAQSSVEWFFQQIRNNGGGFTAEELFEWHKQAKQIEKLQHYNTWTDSRIECKGDDYVGIEKTFEQYYNETFKPKDNGTTNSSRMVS